MAEPSMTCVLALVADFDGQPCAHLGIDFPAVGGLPVSEIFGRQDDLFDIIVREGLQFDPALYVGEPLIVGVMQIVGGTKRLDFSPIRSIKPSNIILNLAAHFRLRFLQRKSRLA